MLRPAELRTMHPVGRMKPYLPLSPAGIAERNGIATPCGSYHWGALLRVDVLAAPADTYLVFFGTGSLQARGLAGRQWLRACWRARAEEQRLQKLGKNRLTEAELFALW